MTQAPGTKGFLDILEASMITQYVLGPTHREGHALDLVLTGEGTSIPSESSDHGSVVCLSPDTAIQVDCS